MNQRPIVEKYCEGKLKRTLKREWKRTEILIDLKFKKKSKGGWKVRMKYIFHLFLLSLKNDLNNFYFENKF